MIKYNENLEPSDLQDRIDRFFALSNTKIKRLAAAWDPADGAPVFTRNGRYTTRGWTEWTQGFQFGCQILQFEATGDAECLELGRAHTLERMTPHLTHTGVHDHGFNTISTFGNLRRLAREGRITEPPDRLDYYELAIKVSGAVQAARWTRIEDGTGFIHSFNGPHSLFSDTIRSCRVLLLAHTLGHHLSGENDRRISLLARAVEHARNTMRFNVYFGKHRDAYDVRGRVAHESIFNVTDGRYRCPSTQQGYSPFTTWTRGMAWVLLGFAELIEFFKAAEVDLEPYGGDKDVLGWLRDTAKAVADYYIESTPSDGIPYWDTGAPGLVHIKDHTIRPAQIDNEYEPVDSSAAAIAAQGLLRLGHTLGKSRAGKPYWQVGLTVARTLFGAPYLSDDANHHGLILHSVYHRPNGWDLVPKGKAVPQGESSMWGDYHAMELAVYLKRIVDGERYLKFFDE